MKTTLKFFLALAGLLSAICSFGQLATYQFVKGIPGSNQCLVKPDASGNIYVVGDFIGTNVDFDPGPAFFNMTSSNSNHDLYVAKFTSTGSFLWAFKINTSTNDFVNKIEVDASSNVYITGGAYGGGADFDPGAGTTTITGGFVAKYSPSGNLVWAYNLGGTNSGVKSIYISGSYFYITGGINGTGDFDPGAPISNVSGAPSGSSFIAKYDLNCGYQWAYSYAYNFSTGNTGDDITVDAAGNCYVVGNFTGSSIDFDPGAANAFLSTSVSDAIYLAKYSSTGTYIWAQQVGTTAGGTSVSRESYKFVDVDPAGNIYLFAGWSGANSNFGAATITSAGSDVLIAKYSSSGTNLFAKSIGVSGGTLYGFEIHVGNSGAIYVTGSMASNPGNKAVDFNPGSGVNNLTTLSYPSSVAVAFIAKYDLSGNYLWAFQNAYPSNTPTTRGKSVYHQGTDLYWGCIGTGLPTDYDYDPSASVNTHSNINNSHFAKYSDCTFAPAQPSTITGVSNICQGAGTTTYTISVVSGATTYVWTLPGGWGGTSTTNTISATPGASGGNISVTASNACGTSSASVLSVTVNPNPTIVVNSGSICSGSSFTMTPSGASSYTYSSGSAVVSPTANASYSVTGTSSAGCVGSNAAVASVTVVAKPTASASTTQSITCTSANVTLNGSGASTYTWTGPSIVSGSNTASPTVNATGVYSLVGSTSGCTSNPATVAVTANTIAPAVSITATSNSLCAGSTATLTGSGAGTYTWSTGSNSTSIVITPSSTTNYTLTGMNTVNGCTASVTKNITVAPLPTVTANSFSATCTGSMGCLTAGGASTYTWTGPCGFSSTTQSPCFPFSMACQCAYSLTGTDANGCKNSATVCITVNPLPTVTAVSNSSLICGPPFQGTATITAGGASTYSWNTSATASSISVSPSVTTVYTVTGTNSNGCVNTATVTQNVSACTGIKTFEEALELNAYPNPTTDKITLTYKMQWLGFEIYNSLGQKLSVPSVINKSDIEIDLSAQPNGIYFIKVDSVTRKIIKE